MQKSFEKENTGWCSFMFAVANMQDTPKCLMVLEILHPEMKLEQFIDLRGNTLLHIAASAGNNNLLKYLKAETNIDLDARNKKGMTALDICINEQNE